MLLFPLPEMPSIKVCGGRESVIYCVWVWGERRDHEKDWSIHDVGSECI